MDKIKILIIEDEKTLGETIRDILMLKGFDVLLVYDGLEGYNAVFTFSPNLILSDIKMPKLNGIEMIHKIKKNDEIKHIPVIFITAKTEIEEIQEAFEAGVDDYILKPFDLSSTMNTINSVLNIKY